MHLSWVAHGLPIRVVNVLTNAQIGSVAELRAMSRAELIDIPGLGPRSLAAIEELLAREAASEFGYGSR